jgi:hypothetical protein
MQEKFQQQEKENKKRKGHGASWAPWIGGAATILSAAILDRNASARQKEDRQLISSHESRIDNVENEVAGYFQAVSIHLKGVESKIGNLERKLAKCIWCFSFSFWELFGGKEEEEVKRENDEN